MSPVFEELKMQYKLKLGVGEHLPYGIFCVLRTHNIFLIDDCTGKVTSLYDKPIYRWGSAVPITSEDLIGYVEEVQDKVSLHITPKYILGKVDYEDFEEVETFYCPIEASKALHVLDLHDDDCAYQVRLDYKAEWK